MYDVSHVIVLCCAFGALKGNGPPLSFQPAILHFAAQSAPGPRQATTFPKESIVGYTSKAFSPSSGIMLNTSHIFPCVHPWMIRYEPELRNFSMRKNKNSC